MILNTLDKIYNVAVSLWDLGMAEHKAKLAEKRQKQRKADEVYMQWLRDERAYYAQQEAQERSNKRVLDSIVTLPPISAKTLRDRGLSEGWLVGCPGCGGTGQFQFVHYQGGSRYEFPTKCSACKGKGYYPAR